MPDNYKAMVGAMQVLNFNLFTFIPVGCLTEGFDLYAQVLATTLPVIAALSALIVAGFVTKRQQLFTAGLAVSYITLPTITTLVFSLFPCDDFNDGTKMLRADLSISCLSPGRVWWELYGFIMILIFPVGVTAAYWALLYSKRDKLRREVEGRLEDEEILGTIFLWEPYKPQYYWWEVFETAKRLLMTGVLSAISPGPFIQLNAGIFMAVVFTCAVCLCNPYNEMRDNAIAISSNMLIIFTFIVSSLLKSQDLLAESKDEEGAEGLGLILVCATILLVLIFFVWAYHAMHDMSRSSLGLASRALKRFGSRGGKGSNGSTLGGAAGKGSGSGGGSLEMGEIGGASRGSIFEEANPMHKKPPPDGSQEDQNNKEEGSTMSKNNFFFLDAQGEKKKFVSPNPLVKDISYLRIVTEKRADKKEAAIRRTTKIEEFKKPKKKRKKEFGKVEGKMKERKDIYAKGSSDRSCSG